MGSKSYLMIYSIEGDEIQLDDNHYESLIMIFDETTSASLARLSRIQFAFVADSTPLVE